MKYQSATYNYIPEKHRNGMFYVTSCCHNTMYSVFDDPYRYHGMLCPKCSNFRDTYTTLYLVGTEEANKLENNVESL